MRRRHASALDERRQSTIFKPPISVWVRHQRIQLDQEISPCNANSFAALLRKRTDVIKPVWCRTEMLALNATGGIARATARPILTAMGDSNDERRHHRITRIIRTATATADTRKLPGRDSEHHPRWQRLFQQSANELSQ